MDRLSQMYFRKRSRINTDLGKFFLSAEETGKMLTELEAKVKAVKHKHAEILAIPITTDTRIQELDELNGQIKSIQFTLKNKLRTIERVIQDEQKPVVRETLDLESPSEANEDGEDPGRKMSFVGQSRKGSVDKVGGLKYMPVGLRIRKTQHLLLCKRFTDILTEYQTAQVNYRHQVKTRLKRQMEITNSRFSETDLENMIDEGKVTAFTKSIIFETKVAKKSLEDIQARNNDLMKLEKSLRELAELFQELATRVEIQGGIVDNILFNVENSQNYVDQGVIVLKVAIPLQRRARKRKAYVLTAVSLVVILIFIALFIAICL